MNLTNHLFRMASALTFTAVTLSANGTETGVDASSEEGNVNGVCAASCAGDGDGA